MIKEKRGRNRIFNDKYIKLVLILNEHLLGWTNLKAFF